MEQDDSLYGNETKDRLETLFPPEKANDALRLLDGIRFVVLNVSLWHCRKNWRVPRRQISDTLILFALDGRFHLEIDGQEKTIGPGECAVIPEHLPHTYSLAGGCSAGSNIIVHVLPLYDLLENPFRGFDSPFLKLEYPESFFSRLKMSVALKNSSRHVALSYAAHILQDLFLEKIRTGSFHPSPNSGLRTRLSGVFEFISNNYKHDFSIEELAAVVNLKQARFRRIFREACAMAPNEYVHRIRLQNAARLLVRFNWELSRIAAAAGFHSSTYFCTSFRKHFHMTPEQFRQAYSN